MQWSLFLLILMGQCFFSTCYLYEYHFIRENKTWEEAQKYCRENYADLASVFDMTDMARLHESREYEGKAWIGLFSNPGKENRMWHWSLPGVEYTERETRWGRSEPGDLKENCVKTRGNWTHAICENTLWFICYDGKKRDGKSIHLIKKKMTWTKAQNYCRDHYTDLASGLDQADGEEFKILNKSQGSPMNVWIGLFRDTWRWSDGSNFSFRHWNMESFYDGQNNRKCAVTLLNRSGKWSSDECNKKNPFFCYDDKLILINENKTWEEALDYCRLHHTDLVSITNPHQQRVVERRTKNASSPYVWVGLRYTCVMNLWLWISDRVVCYENWADKGKIDECHRCAAMERGGRYQWVSKSEYEKYNFICSKQ
ncbi:macrophage mannose receptor 1-like isoform X1 [Oreochromis aureus]|uniref:macrophage mannose receptor 1-like isoform X1 n=2 Tax=Oreochromis aureus TaxID=47969 RepID=UPI001952A812|nr:macrophage mannose receptor 1-like isoform X1 [Oreochromis aureus]XP_039465628.1 macrophage mannose receptor 1-like isoform X1 [Oreochromis aureus]XP_039465630.1 macrophage mannose receptor 1-like isoform X1 [Oreochromis aureus]XP_039465631.1 macrophage mannose receptor 1-like isoform X1 [Oreochromis aureus]